MCDEAKCSNDRSVGLSKSGGFDSKPESNGEKPDNAGNTKVFIT